CLSPEESEQLTQAGWLALLEAAEDQKREVADQDPARRFLTLVAAAITSGRGHLVSPKTGAEPEAPEAWGWQPVTLKNDAPGWQPRGHLLGWIAGDEILLEPEAAFAAAQHLAAEQGDHLPGTQQQLYRRLKDTGLLLATEKNKTTLRRKIQGAYRTVLFLRVS